MLTFADATSELLKATAEKTIKDRKEQIERIEASVCETLKSSMDGILMALSTDARLLATDAYTIKNPQRNDDITKMYRERLPKHTSELSDRLNELAKAVSLCM